MTTGTRIASYGNADLDFGIDVDTWALGAGYAFPLQGKRRPVRARALPRASMWTPPRWRLDDDGLGLQFRIRARVTDELELEGGIQYVDVEDSDTSLQVGAATTSPKLSRRASGSRLPGTPTASASTRATRSDVLNARASRRARRAQPQEPHAERVPQRHAMQRQRADVIDEQHAQRDGKHVEPAVRSPVPRTRAQAARDRRAAKPTVGRTGLPSIRGTRPTSGRKCAPMSRSVTGVTSGKTVHSIQRACVCASRRRAIAKP